MTGTANAGTAGSSADYATLSGTLGLEFTGQTILVPVTLSSTTASLTRTAPSP